MKNANHFGTSHFGSNHVLLTRTVAGYSVLFFCHFPGETLLHATLGMECDGSSKWVCPGSRGPRPLQSVADGIRLQVVGSATARASPGSMASTECWGPECNAPTTSTRSRRGVGGCTLESLQFGGGIGGHGESFASRMWTLAAVEKSKAKQAAK